MLRDVGDAPQRVPRRLVVRGPQSGQAGIPDDERVLEPAREQLQEAKDVFLKGLSRETLQRAYRVAVAATAVTSGKIVVQSVSFAHTRAHGRLVLLAAPAELVAPAHQDENLNPS